MKHSTIYNEIRQYMKNNYKDYTLGDPTETNYSNKASNKNTISVVIFGNSLVFGGNFYLNEYEEKGNDYIVEFVDKAINDLRQNE